MGDTWFRGLLISFCLLSPGTALAQDTEYHRLLASAVESPGDADKARRFFDILPKTTLPFAPVELVGVVEGDRLVTYPDGLTTYLLERKGTPADSDDANPELILHTVAGVDALWDLNSKTIRYAVVRQTFSTEEQYDSVVADMAAAAGEWNAVCDSCGIDITHVAGHDDITSWEEYLTLAADDSLRFIVVYSADANGPIASAFFPSDIVNERILAVFPDYFGGSSFPAVGVLRHELGHVLGYRHEHTRDVPGCNTESADWRPLTEYDPHSVMHYFCGGSGSPNLEITDIDRAGHEIAYGTAAAQ